MDYREDELSPDDIERLEERVRLLRSLVNDPIALIERAQALLEGRPEPLV